MTTTLASVKTSFLNVLGKPWFVPLIVFIYYARTMFAQPFQDDIWLLRKDGRLDLDMWTYLITPLWWDDAGATSYLYFWRPWMKFLFWNFKEWVNALRLIQILLFVSTLLLLRQLPKRMLSTAHPSKTPEWLVSMCLLVFAVHPTRQESLFLITNGMDIWAFFFFLLSAHALFSRRSWIHWFCLPLAVLAYFSKESSVFYLLFVFLIPDRKKMMRYAVMAGLGYAFAILCHKWVIGLPPREPISIFHAQQSWGSFAIQTLMPVSFHAPNIYTGWEPWFYANYTAGTLFMLALLWLLYRAVRKPAIRWFLFGCALFLPTSNLMGYLGTENFFSARFLYVPHALLTLAALTHASPIGEWISRLRSWRLMLAIHLLVLLCYSHLFSQNLMTREAFYTARNKTVPSDLDSALALHEVYTSQGKHKRALAVSLRTYKYLLNRATHQRFISIDNGLDALLVDAFSSYIKLAEDKDMRDLDQLRIQVCEQMPYYRKKISPKTRFFGGGMLLGKSESYGNICQAMADKLGIY